MDLLSGYSDNNIFNPFAAVNNQVAYNQANMGANMNANLAYVGGQNQAALNQFTSDFNTKGASSNYGHVGGYPSFGEALGGGGDIWSQGAPAFNDYNGGATPGGFSPSPNYPGGGGWQMGADGQSRYTDPGAAGWNPGATANIPSSGSIGSMDWLGNYGGYGPTYQPPQQQPQAQPDYSWMGQQSAFQGYGGGANPGGFSPSPNYPGGSGGSGYLSPGGGAFNSGADPWGGAWNTVGSVEGQGGGAGGIGSDTARDQFAWMLSQSSPYATPGAPSNGPYPNLGYNPSMQSWFAPQQGANSYAPLYGAMQFPGSGTASQVNPTYSSNPLTLQDQVAGGGWSEIDNQGQRHFTAQ